MKLEMRPILGQYQKCPACDGYLHDHDEDCPQGKLTVFCREMALRERKCPKCYEGRVAVNKTDFYECRRCHVQFSAGLVAGGEDPAKLERTYLLADDAIGVLVMRNKGDGKFRDDEIVAMLRKEIVERTLERKRRRADADDE
jgi:hypothetical protein